MADDLPVTVNIVGNLAPLEEALRRGAQMSSAFEQTPTVKEVHVKASRVVTESVETNRTADITSPLKSSSTADQVGELRLLQRELDEIDSKMRAVREANEDPLPGWVEARAEVVAAMEAIKQAQTQVSQGVTVNSGTVQGGSAPEPDKVDAATLRLISLMSQLETSGKLTADATQGSDETLTDLFSAATELRALLGDMITALSGGSNSEEQTEPILKAIASLEEIMAQSVSQSPDFDGLADALASAVSSALGGKDQPPLEVKPADDADKLSGIPIALQKAMEGIDTGEWAAKSDDELLEAIKELMRVQSMIASGGDVDYSNMMAEGMADFGAPMIAAVREALKDAPPERPEPRIIDATNKGPKEDKPIELPTYQNEEIQARRLIDLTRQWGAERRRIMSEGDPNNEADVARVNKLNAALKAAYDQMVALKAAGVQATSSGAGETIYQAVDRRAGMAEPTRTSNDMADLEALEKYHNALSKLREEVERGGEPPAFLTALDTQLELTSNQLDDLERKLSKEFTLKKAAKETVEKAPKQPKEEEPVEQPDFLETIGQVVRLTETAGVSTGAVGTLARSTANLSTAFKGLTGAVGGSMLALAGVVVVVAAAVAAIAALVAVLVSSIKAADEAAQKYIKLSGALGSIEEAKLTVKEVELVTEGTGIDPASILALHERMSRRAREALLSGPGLDLIVRASARLDPESAGTFGAAIGDAYETLRSNPQSITSNIEELNRLGLITDEASASLELMARRGANSRQIWEQLYTAISKNADAEGKANKTLGGLMSSLGQDISTTWTQMLRAMGEEIVKELGPGFESISGMVQRVKPTLIGLAQWLGGVIGSIGKWVSAAIEGAITGLGVLKNMFLSGDLGTFVMEAMTYALLSAANSFINSLVLGVQYLGDLLIGAISMLGDGDFWSGIGDYLLSAAWAFLGVMAGLGGKIFDAMAPVVDYIAAAFNLIGAKLAGTLMVAVASMMPTLTQEQRDKKDAYWNEGKALQGKTWDEAKAEEKGKGRSMGESADRASDEALKEAQSLRDQAGESIGRSKDKAFQEFDPTKYVKPDIFAEGIADAAGKMGVLIEQNMPDKPTPKVDEPKPLEIPELKDPFGQGGPQSVADSLQSVGGGGNAAGVSIQERILDENKAQTAELRKANGKEPVDPNKMLNKNDPYGKVNDDGKSFTNMNPDAKGYKLGERVELNRQLTPEEMRDAKSVDWTAQTNPNTEVKTPNIAPAYGGGPAGGGSETNTLLTSINSTLVSILNAIVSGGGATKQSTGSLVTVRG